MLQTTDAQAPRRGRRQRAEAAIAHALGRRWEQAAAENRALLEEDASDIEAANRLGKALTELDDLAGAEQAYLAALTIDGANAIARRNLGRIQEALAGAQRKPAKAKAARGAAAKKGARGGGKAAAAARPAAATVSIIEATGASAEFALQRPVLAALQRLEPGDTLELAATESGVAVTTERGVVLGQIEPRGGLRLRRMIEGGNRYTVILRQITEGGATVHVRESHRDPSLVGQVSFLPPRAAARRAPTRARRRWCATTPIPTTTTTRRRTMSGARAPAARRRPRTSSRRAASPKSARAMTPTRPTTTTRTKTTRRPRACWTTSRPTRAMTTSTTEER